MKSKPIGSKTDVQNIQSTVKPSEKLLKTSEKVKELEKSFSKTGKHNFFQKTSKSPSTEVFGKTKLFDPEKALKKANHENVETSAKSEKPKEELKELSSKISEIKIKSPFPSFDINIPNEREKTDIEKAAKESLAKYQ